MKYYICDIIGLHDSASDKSLLPRRIFGELSEDMMEIRKVYIYEPNVYTWADAQHYSDMCRLSWEKIPEIPEINEDPHFHAREITKE
ncbi:MAG: DUF6881 domain-containing protein, partial [Bradyrhizobium sp.]